MTDKLEWSTACRIPVLFSDVYKRYVVNKHLCPYQTDANAFNEEKLTMYLTLLVSLHRQFTFSIVLFLS